MLTEFIERRLDTPFAWGRSDCCLFAADAVLAITAVDHAAKFRGRYKTARGARQLLEASGGVAGMVERAGLIEVAPLLAQRGDVVLLETEHGDALGIVGMDGKCAGQGQRHLIFESIERARRAWRV